MGVTQRRRLRIRPTTITIPSRKILQLQQRLATHRNHPSDCDAFYNDVALARPIWVRATQ